MRLQHTDTLLHIAVAIWMFLICVAIISVFMALTGCSTVQVPKPVDVVVKTDCHPARITHAPWATSAMQPATDIYGQAQLLLEERQQRIDYEKELEAAATACQ